MVSTVRRRRGASDWLIQRISAVVLAIYTLGLLGWFAWMGMVDETVDFTTWHALNTALAMRIANTLMLLALIAHAWVGVWTIITDYVTPARLQAVGCSQHAAVAHVFCVAATILWLLACLIWGAVIIWAGV